MSDEEFPKVVTEGPNNNRKTARNRLACVLVVLVFLLSLIIVLCLTIKARVTLIVMPDKLIVPDTDTREYRVIQLTNTIKVALISDRESRTAATSFNVAVGSLSNPDEYLGLAHYLEHMLFMGTEKYPTENMADKFASENDGWINAWTDDANTNYYFLVENAGLYNMSDIYAQFFIKPLLNKTSLYREMQAVDSEYKNGFSSNFWPDYELTMSIASPKSPHARFSTGSISTLNKTDIQDELWKFYDSYYSANLITVAIIGNETLDTLQDWAEEIFTAIPNKNRKKPEFNTVPFPPNDTRYIQRKIYYIPKSDSDTLKVVFPINVRGYPNLSYITYLLGYEGSGSLFQYLSTRGFITSLSSQLSVEASNFILVGIYSELTLKGLNDIDGIVEAMFKYIRRIREEGISEKLWTENKKIDELKFKFQEKQDPASYASTISANMAIREDPRDYLNPPSRRVYNQSLEELIMRHLTPDNMNLYISSTKLSAEKDTLYGPQLTDTEKWYDTPYQNTQIDPAMIDNWQKVDLDENLYLPLANIFRPENFELVDESKAKSLPVQLNNTGDINLWWYQDTQFKQPKINLGCRIHPVPTRPTAESEIVNTMLSKVFSREASAALYPATIVGYDMTLGISDYWVLWISGFSDPNKVKTLIEKSMDIFFEIDFEADEAYFNSSVREPIRKDAKNFENAMPVNLCRTYANMIQNKNVFDYKDTLDILDSISLKNVKAMRDTVVSNMTIDCSAMGNVLDTQATNYIKILQTKLEAKGKALIVKEDRLNDFKYPLSKIPYGTYIYRTAVLNKDEPNSGVLVLFQIGPDASNGPYTDNKPYTRSVMVSILALLMREPCFNYLRTQKQLGYVATCYQYSYENIMTYSLLVQGSRADAGAEVMATEIDNFLQMKYDEFVSNKDTPEGKQLWEDIKVALRKQLEEKPVSLSDITSKFNKEIFKNDRDFKRQEKKVEALKDLTMDLFLDFYHRYLIADTKRKISSQVYGKGHTVPSSVKDGETLIDNIAEFRATITDTYAEDE